MLGHGRCSGTLIAAQRHLIPYTHCILLRQDYNYNPAHFTYNGNDYLMVRVENRTGSHQAWSYGGPSVFAWSRLHSPLNASAITLQNVVFGNGVDDVEDPRIIYREEEQLYYMMYTKSDGRCTPNPCARLALATASNPLDAQSWEDHGQLWPDLAGFQWTKSGAVVVSDDLSQRPHMLIWSSWCQFKPLWVSPLFMQVATSTNLRHWSIVPSPLMSKRGLPDYLDNRTFDSYVIESGPPPVRLSDGNLLFLYNGARECPTGKPDYSRCYAMGWVVLDGDDPGRVVARVSADDPLLEPKLIWEVARRSSAEHLIATKALCCTATARMLTVAESFAKF